VQLTEKHKEYWRKNLTITAVLLFCWLVLTFVIGYTGVQGPLVLYVAIVGFYAWYMSKQDHVYGVHEEEEGQ
jgi:uncharacterized membrane protein